MIRRKQTAVWLAGELGCERTNVYNIFRRKSLDTHLLMRLCLILRHNFYRDLAGEAQKLMRC